MSGKERMFAKVILASALSPLNILQDMADLE
ncbi:hypothetical protein GGE12_002443 [Rhizobium mongolense]|uniref:Uncharacterized protein n=1 Tax=Rhizobium mongolense TaxID=57676 RepID=A0A7W6RLV7_9HYPH|nr:hypothetical protein [Rhizobium mongolense]